MGRTVKYKIIPTPHFVKDFSKLDEFVKKRIKIYLENIAEDPRSKGKILKANRKGQWRYRIGDYRVIVNIQDENLVVLALQVGHRKNIYNSWYWGCFIKLFESVQNFV